MPARRWIAVVPVALGLVMPLAAGVGGAGAVAPPYETIQVGKDHEATARFLNQGIATIVVRWKSTPGASYRILRNINLMPPRRLLGSRLAS